MMRKEVKVVQFVSELQQGSHCGRIADEEEIVENEVDFGINSSVLWRFLFMG